MAGLANTGKSPHDAAMAMTMDKATARASTEAPAIVLAGVDKWFKTQDVSSLPKPGRFPTRRDSTSGIRFES